MSLDDFVKLMNWLCGTTGCSFSALTTPLTVIDFHFEMENDSNFKSHSEMFFKSFVLLLYLRIPIIQNLHTEDFR